MSTNHTIWLKGQLDILRNLKMCAMFLLMPSQQPNIVGPNIMLWTASCVMICCFLLSSTGILLFLFLLNKQQSLLQLFEFFIYSSAARMHLQSWRIPCIYVFTIRKKGIGIEFYNFNITKWIELYLLHNSELCTNISQFLKTFKLQDRKNFQCPLF